MYEFETWWKKHWIDKPHWLHRQCFEEGYNCAMAQTKKENRRMAIASIIALIALAGLCFIKGHTL
jgi:hypothetical protein